VRRGKWLPVVLLAAAVGVGCGNSVKDLQFSEPGKDNNWISVFRTTIKSDKLSQEENSLLQAALLREMQQVPPSIAGKTVRQVIKDQREWLKANPKK
jgi:hypothetical protein